MANRFYSPNEQFCDATGAPYAGGSLAFYASGTSTPLNTYSDSALTQPNTNPVVLDSAGRAGNIFLQNLAYKVVLSDVNSNPIWTDDPVYSSDYSARAKFASGAGSPNGNTAGTAGSASIGADTYWDTTNNILYVCTQTGTSSTAVWTAVNASTAASVIPAPQGFLGLIGTASPIVTTDTTSSTVYYSPLTGNVVPIYNGSAFVPTVFSEINLGLVSQHSASTIYDVFIFNNSGVLTLVTGPQWSSSAAGSGARGSGAGTTALARLSGFWVNSVSMTGRNGNNTYSVPANQGTYLGSIFIDTTPAQVTCHTSYGQSRKWGVWNAYNRQIIELQAGDGTASWVYAASPIRPSNNATANSLTSFYGLPEEEVFVSFMQQIQMTDLSASSAIKNISIGIGRNSSTAYAGTQGAIGFGSASSSNARMVTEAKYTLLPTIGIDTFTACESSNPTGSFTATFAGSQSNMTLSARWRA